MRLVLKDFQVDAVAQLVRQLRRAAREARDGDAQAVSLSSPTGSGKTVMATAAIERLIDGDADNTALPDATFLWITDQPELNEQTRRKMLTTSTILGPSELLVVDQTFDAELLEPGRVYFLNTQKLARTGGLVTPGDSRTFTFWDTVTNTVAERPGAFFVFIDEAHRGMGENRRARTEATTIIQKFIKGSAGEIPAIPLIAGISATVERFQRLIEGTPRTARPIDLDPTIVRESGLLKEVILLYHPTESDPSDITMLRAAARSFQDFCERWDRYCSAEAIPQVRPILVVQVEDASGRQLSRTDLGEAINAINAEIGPIHDTAFAHAFQEGTRVSIGDRPLRYLAPADIDADEDVRVVFFKTSLHTGWDCPRAEVMMSFRRALDATSIAQLVGRMVRTPLARRVDADEHLNSVPLYLPHYDEEGLQRVVDQLTSPDPDALAPIRIERGRDRVTLSRASGSDACFAALERLPSYVVPRTTRTSQVRRLMKLARLLANDDIEPDAPEHAADELLRVLRSEHKRVSRTRQFKAVVDDKATVDVRGVSWRLGSGLDDATESVHLDISAENVDDVFEAAGRRLGEGIHKAWWRARVASGTPVERAKLELFALCLEGDVIDAVEAAAQAATQDRLARHRHALRGLPEARRQAYDDVLRLATNPERADLSYPDAIDITKGKKKWSKHLYVNGDGPPLTFNTWETDVINAEIVRDDVIGWLRNIDRRPWALAVPYEIGGTWRPLYPDFLVVRKDGANLVVDLLDPHSLSLEDAPAKAAGLAKYADRHAPDFGRMELIIVDGRRIRRLDLTDETIRDRVKAVQTHAHLRQLFDA